MCIWLTFSCFTSPLAVRLKRFRIESGVKNICNWRVFCWVVSTLLPCIEKKGNHRREKLQRANQGSRRVTQSRILKRWFFIKEKPWNLQDLSLRSRLVCKALSNSLNISTALTIITTITTDLFKVLAVLSDATFKRSAVEQEDPGPYWISEKKTIFVKVINKPNICKCFKVFVSAKGKQSSNTYWNGWLICIKVQFYNHWNL